eukprot:1094066-Amorphochlora_amoeboformis.AAC.1
MPFSGSQAVFSHATVGQNAIWAPPSTSRLDVAFVCSSASRLPRLVFPSSHLSVVSSFCRLVFRVSSSGSHHPVSSSASFVYVAASTPVSN